ncbi:[FeFe] hydrogenase, group A [Anaerovorax odorimutans]|uniref:[FeFe] hydrogenase, group A n=1 Tax=Anaerovorax odorimutans TaxID=109327 RepID=UPI0003F4FF89|nr:[FeFe] hydrogenase, group A [Anaerovorax odorimutans]
MNKKYITIDGILAPIEGEKNILDIIRKIGIELPTFCYNSDLSVYGACRMCVVEDKHGNIMASCSTPPRSGMEIKTNTPKLQQHRKMILELILADHCRDCTTCEKNFKCKLQDIAQKFGLREVRFENYSPWEEKDTSSPSIVRDSNKCILCGDCVRMCSEIQKVGAIDFAYRGSNMEITPAFKMPIAETNCVNCGQCSAVCPTGAIVVKDDTEKVWHDLYDDNVIMVAQIAPAVRVALGDEFGIPEGSNVMGKIVTALKRMGFDDVYDTATGADLTVIEEANEFVDRLENGGKLPLFTSCCPAWFKYAEINHPDITDNISSCKSPMQMFASVLKEQARKERPKKKAKKTKVVAIMPCTAKKYEANREEFKFEDDQAVDYSITTQELANMIRESGIVFSEILPEAVDMPFGIASGAGVIFGVTGGVTEAVIRYVLGPEAKNSLKAIAFTGVRGFEGVKEVIIPYKETELKIAIVSGLSNANNLVEKIKSGECYYDFVEVMACPGGCISGAGQPSTTEKRTRNKRAEGMYEADRMSNVKISSENPTTLSLYKGILRGHKAHELLHYK